MTNPLQTPNKPFIKILWEIHFVPAESEPKENPPISAPPMQELIKAPEQHLFVPPTFTNPADAQFLLKLMTMFHTTSAKLVDELLSQAKSLKDFTEKDAEKNFEIAKMIGWIKMLQQLIEKLRHDIS